MRARHVSSQRGSAAGERDQRLLIPGLGDCGFRQLSRLENRVDVIIGQIFRNRGAATLESRELNRGDQE